MGVVLLLNLYNIMLMLFSNFYNIKCDVEIINHKMKVKCVIITSIWQTFFSKRTLWGGGGGFFRQSTNETTIGASY